MKLPIKKIYLDEIKKGWKRWDFRDAHITFVCEENGEKLRAKLTSVMFCPRKMTKKRLRLTSREMKNMFEDETQVGFGIEL